jgi:hypothetical protein|tara:strand:- start:121 stop:273 length:153 start_codon:yes stop_codon:yes gene_type:complete
MDVKQFAGQGLWSHFLNDTLSTREQAEKNHIIEEGRDAEEEFKRKHFKKL